MDAELRSLAATAFLRQGSTAVATLRLGGLFGGLLTPD